MRKDRKLTRAIYGTAIPEKGAFHKHPPHILIMRARPAGNSATGKQLRLQGPESSSFTRSSMGPGSDVIVALGGAAHELILGTAATSEAAAENEDAYKLMEMSCMPWRGVAERSRGH